MGLFDANWAGIGKTFARGPHTNDPSDPQYEKHWEVVPGSLPSPSDGDRIIGAYEPDPGSGRVGTQASVRFIGDLAYVDRAILPEPAIGLLKPLGWAAKSRSIEPAAIPRSTLAISRDSEGRRTASIPREYGGGSVHERPGAIQGRANDATPREQLIALKGMFTRPRWRR